VHATRPLGRGCLVSLLPTACFCTSTKGCTGCLCADWGPGAWCAASAVVHTWYALARGCSRMTRCDWCHAAWAAASCSALASFVAYHDPSFQVRWPRSQLPRSARRRLSAAACRPARPRSQPAQTRGGRAAWLRALLLLACAAAAAAACRVQTGPARAQSWADVYYFCGPDLQYCTCDFTWNARGWGQALLLWNFVLTAALVRPRAPRRAGPCARPRARCPRRPAPPRATLSCRARAQGLQKLVIQVGLGGLLAGAPPPPGRGPAPAPRRLRAAWPGAAADARARVCACARGGAHARARRGAGEEVVTKESFISICWRLIPYWLNNWEQRWGAEVSSMTFELPHFAMELLVVLPVVQARGPPAAAAG